MAKDSTECECIARRCEYESADSSDHSDLLNRHRTAHAKTDGDRLRRRTPRACEACIKAKTRCDDLEARPCKRCEARGIECHTTEGLRQTNNPQRRRKSSPAPTQDEEFNEEPDYDGEMPPSNGQSDVVDNNGGGMHHFDMQTSQQADPQSASRYLEDASLLLGLNGTSLDSNGLAPFDQSVHGMHMTDPNLTSAGMLPFDNDNSMLQTSDPSVFPDFFEQIMMSGNDTFIPNYTGIVPDVSNFTSDLTFDTCDFDFSFLASGLTRPSTAQGYHTYQAADNRVEEVAGAFDEEQTPQSDAKLRSDAFERNPWSWNHWIPERNRGAFAGQDEINISGSHVEPNDQLTSPGKLNLTRCELAHAERDRMIRVITHVAHTKLAVPSFPSLELLGDLVDIYLLQATSALDSFFHAASFTCKDARTEMLLCFVAAGARYIALPPVWKMGLVIQEVARLAIADLFENDNSTTRELQVLQAFVLSLDIGVWSGLRRKTELALSFLQPALTMMVWSGSLQRSNYGDVLPYLEDSAEILQEKWHLWIERESRKRLWLHSFLHDAQVAIVNMRNPLISPAQLTLPLPASRELWTASSAESWRREYLRILPPKQTELPTVVEFLGHLGCLEQLSAFVDKDLCLMVACHSISHEVRHFRQRARLLHSWQDEGRRNRWLEHQRLQRDLLDELSAMHASCEMQTTECPELLLTLELQMMSLHADLEDIQTFSGKLGEDEARRVYPKILTWTQSVEARTAVWHAGQVFLCAKNFEMTKLRDFYAVALYHAALTLWVYGMVTSNTTRKSGAQTPAHGRTASWTPHVISSGEQAVLIDTNDDRASKAFTLLGQGSPGVQNLQYNFVPLSNSRGLMASAEAILKSNFPQSRHGLPPLVENLAHLMNELGRLSGG